jgi:hypothetical protein
MGGARARRLPEKGDSMAVPERAQRLERIEQGRRAEVPRADQPAYQAYLLLYVGFIAAPIIAGADKFFHLLTTWQEYLAPQVPRLTGLDSHTFMMGVGVIEMIAGIIVAVKPKIGGVIVGLWLCGIIVNLLVLGRFYDVALRDLGLALGAFALSRLAATVERRGA